MRYLGVGAIRCSGLALSNERNCVPLIDGLLGDPNVKPLGLPRKEKASGAIAALTRFSDLGNFCFPPITDASE